ncbi:MAG: M42 family metallopeptidase [Clostridia bacterium]|nr:M42 family metallopeptidase [Clostridia bacterium]MBR2908600.1 M42 family metallopeptidase [Clostridia bacterium]
MEQLYAKYATEKALELLAIDSPSGYTRKAADWVRTAFSELGFHAELTTKGGVIIDLGGKDETNALLLEAHVDTLGGMVAEIKGNGRLRLTPLGGMRAENGECENVRVHTRSGKVYEGTLQLLNASVHVNDSYADTKRSFDTTEVLLDENVTTAAETRALGIEVGDVVAFDPRSRVTESGYIKSRFLDDKLSVAILLGFAKFLRDTGRTPERKVYAHVTVYEEVGHGGSASLPQGVTEAISVDMGCVGDGLGCTERMVSICAKDSGGPYCYEVVGGLIEAAKRAGADYAVDVYPHYGSDVEATLRAGHDIRHGLIGPGVYASHGYERSHIDGVLNTLRLLESYILG